MLIYGWTKVKHPKFFVSYHDSLDEYQKSELHPLMDSFQAKNK